MHDLGDLGQRPNCVQLGRIIDLFALGLALCYQRNWTALGHGRVERGHALVSPHLKRHDHLWKDDRLAQGYEGKLPDTGRMDLLLGALDVSCIFDAFDVLVGRPVSHWILLIDSWSREWPLYV